MSGKSRTLKYYTGETVMTYDGINWIMIDLEDNITTLKKVNWKNVAIDMTNI